MLCVQEIPYNCAWQDRWVQERHSTPDMHPTGVLLMLSEASAGAGRNGRIDEAPVGCANGSCRSRPLNAQHCIVVGHSLRSCSALSCQQLLMRSDHPIACQQTPVLQQGAHACNPSLPQLTHCSYCSVVPSKALCITANTVAHAPHIVHRLQCLGDTGESRARLLITMPEQHRDTPA